MGRRRGSQISGYSYSFAVHMGVCRGPVDELVEILVGEKTAYRGALHTNASFSINRPHLFGGEKSEGGIVGTLHFMNGFNDQAVPAAVQAALAGGGTLVPGFRGTTTVFYDGMISQNNPYLKEWKFRVRRSSAGWFNSNTWYPVKAAILLGQDGFGATSIHAMNPAHIIYECSTNPVWGRGLPPSVLDAESFISAANKLCDEGLGLCMKWDRTSKISDFVNEIIQHIGGALYIDRNTGLLTLKLLRDDYVPAELVTFDFDSGLLEIEGDDTGSVTENYNEIIVTYRDPVEDEDRQVRVHNLAAIQQVGYVISKSVTYRGAPTAELAIRLAERDLTANANWLKRYKLKLDRRGWKLAPGMAFKISAPSRGVASIVLRVGDVVDSPLNDGTVTVKAVQDVFGLGATSYLEYAPPSWTPPDRAARTISVREVFEAPFRSLFLELSPADLAVMAATQCTLATLGRSPSDLSQSYDVQSYVAPESYSTGGAGTFSPCAFLVGAIGMYATEIAFTAANGFDTLAVGDAALLGGEWCRVEAFNLAAGTMTIARGCADTLPSAHAAGVTIWLPDGFGGTDSRDYAPSEEVFVRLLTKTSADILAPEYALEDSVIMDQRFYRPYPPGDFQLNGVRYADLPFSLGDVVLTWAHRDRLGQQDRLVDHLAGDEGPEAGVTYTVRVYDNIDGLARTTAGITGTTWTYTDANWTSDGLPTRPRFELESVRDGIPSRVLYSHRLIRTVTDPGWNEGWNFNYGGGP